MKRALIVVFLCGIICGGIVWALSIPITGVREPFDSTGFYYPIALLIAGILATLPSPRHWWIAVVGIFLGERVYAFAALPETRDWLLFGVIVNFLILTWLPTAIGALSTYLVHRYFAER